MLQGDNSSEARERVETGFLTSATVRVIKMNLKGKSCVDQRFVEKSRASHVAPSLPWPLLFCFAKQHL